MRSNIVSIKQGIADIRAGKMIILVDDENRENEGDLCCAAESITPEFINFMAIHGRGLICLTLTEEKANELNLKPMVDDNKSGFETAFTVSIDSRRGITTGISAADRSCTILKTMSENVRASDFVRPGHVFPLRARQGGVLVRPGQTEGSVDLARLAGMQPAGVICEIMNNDGTMSRMPDLKVFAREHGINIVTIADLIRYRSVQENLVKQVMHKHPLPRSPGSVSVAVYTSDFTPDDVYIAFIKGDIKPHDHVLVRIHRECFISEFMGSKLCDCSRKLKRAREIISREDKGILLYIRPRDGITGFENRSDCCCTRKHLLKESQGATQTMLTEKLLSCAISANILSDLGIRNVRSITSDPEDDMSFEPYGLNLAEQVAM